MHLTEKEFEALCGAIDFIATNIDGSTDTADFYIEQLNELRKVRDNWKKERDRKHFKYLVNREYKKLKAQKK